VLIKPGKDWQWNFCHTKNRLTLDLGAEMVFVSAFGQRELVADALSGAVFSIEQSQDFYHYVERIEQQLSIPEQFINHIALNAIAAKTFYKPLMPKSWFFSTATSVSSAKAGNIVLLQSQFESRHYLIVESNTKASTLLLIERDHQLDTSKKLNQFGLIKVMNDRLMPVQVNKAHATNAA
jgi:cell division protein ZapC